MRLRLALLVSLVATVAAFEPVQIPGTGDETAATNGWWKVGGSPERRDVSTGAYSLKLKRTEHPVGFPSFFCPYRGLDFRNRYLPSIALQNEYLTDLELR